MTTSYASPQVYTLGTVEELTAQGNKIGTSSDGFTPQTGLTGIITQVCPNGIVIPNTQVCPGP